MHAITILQKSLSEAFSTMHAARANVLLGAVFALLLGRRLILMELARSWPGAIRVRAPLKRVDRLLSNRHLGVERVVLYAAMARWLVRGPRPIIVVDWSDLDGRRRHHLLRAGVAVGGRTLTIFESIHARCEQGSARAERRLLNSLKAILPPDCRPIIVTDAGFRTPWFKAVLACGWDYIGRVRGHTRVECSGRWQSTTELMRQARSQSQQFDVRLTRNHHWPCRLVLCQRRAKGRQLLNQRGIPQRNKRALHAQQRGREPWLLATSLALPMSQIIAAYGKRMQIEESFRDLKCDRFGCAFQHSQTRQPERIANLLLLLALASFAAYLAAKQLDDPIASIVYGGIVSRRRHYSQLRIGWEALRKARPPTSPTSRLPSLAICP
jgi:Transposase DDE domain